jgi:WD40 repeat protein
MTLREHTAAVRALAVHDNERFILSGSKDGVVKLWSLSAVDHAKITYSGQRLQAIQAVHFVDYGKLFALCDGNVIQLCDVERGTLITQFDHENGYLTFEPFDGILFSLLVLFKYYKLQKCCPLRTLAP